MKKISLWPRSLRYQLLLLILTTILIVQGGTLAVGHYLRENFIEDAVVNYLSTTVLTLRAAVSNVPAEQRAEFIQQASQGKWSLWSREIPANARFVKSSRRNYNKEYTTTTIIKKTNTSTNSTSIKIASTTVSSQYMNNKPPGNNSNSMLNHLTDPQANALSNQAVTNQLGGTPPLLANPNDLIHKPPQPLMDLGSDDGSIALAKPLRKAGDIDQIDFTKYPLGDLRNDLLNIINKLNVTFNDGTRVGLTHGKTPRMFISLQPENNDPNEGIIREWLVIPLDKIERPNMHAIFLMWTGITILLLLITAGFAWRITRPLLKLSLAADNLAEGRPQRVIPEGPSETKNLGIRFNAMLDALEESHEVQNTLLAGLPHDLKAPLARMWLRSEMTDDPMIKEGMRNDVQDMQKMIDQFISFVKGSNLDTYDFQPINLNAWIDERISSWEGAGSPVHLYSIPKENIYINADSISMGRLIDNLISNALKHGQPPVEVNVSRISPDSIQISIGDHGEGIPKDRRKEALRAFSRLDSARTKTGSVGLGLALAEMIAKAHNGLLDLDQTESGGLLVILTVPIDKEHTKAA